MTTKTKKKPKYGWAWPLNIRKAHYFEEGKSISICGKIFYVGGLFELGNDQSEDNCVQCKKKLLGDEAIVEHKAVISFECETCGRTWTPEKPKKYEKKKIKWGDRKNHPKKKTVKGNHNDLMCWCTVSGYACKVCDTKVSNPDDGCWKCKKKEEEQSK